jgi:hypothetical protein
MGRVIHERVMIDPMAMRANAIATNATAASIPMRAIRTTIPRNAFIANRHHRKTPVATHGAN